MALAETTAENDQLNAIPDSEPWRPGKQKSGPPSKRFGVQESTEEKRQAFMEHTAALTPDDWQRTLIYAYQWAPSVDLTRGGRDPKYRKIYTRHMSEEDIKRDLGSGTYELKLNQIDAKGHEKTVDRLVISIMDYSFPPNIPPGPWLDDPKNGDWAWAKPLLEQKFQKITVTNNNGTYGPTWDQMVQFLRDEQRRPEPGSNAKEQLMTSVISILPQLLQQQNNANDPTKMVQLAALFKELFGSGEAKENPLMALLIDEVKSLRESNARLMEKMLDMKTEQVKQPGPVDQVKTMAELLTMVQGIIQPAAPREPWENVVSEIGPKLLDTVDRGLMAWGTRNAMRAAAQRPNPAAAATTTPPTAPPPTQPPTEEQAQVSTMQASMIQNVAILAAQALNLGLAGDHFAEQVCYKFGEATYDTFIATVPKDQLLPQLKADATAWNMLAPFENLLPEFIDSFYAYSEAEPAETQPTAPPPAKPKKSKK